jgi:hypothetical protein
LVGGQDGLDERDGLEGGWPAGAGETGFVARERRAVVAHAPGLVAVRRLAAPLHRDAPDVAEGPPALLGTHLEGAGHLRQGLGVEPVAVLLSWASRWARRRRGHPTHLLKKEAAE